MNDNLQDLRTHLEKMKSDHTVSGIGADLDRLYLDLLDAIAYVDVEIHKREKV